MFVKGDCVLFCVQKRQVMSLVMKIPAKKKKNVLILFAISCCAKSFKAKHILLTLIFTLYLKQTFINCPGSLTHHCVLLRHVPSHWDPEWRCGFL